MVISPQYQPEMPEIKKPQGLLLETPVSSSLRGLELLF
jgi:hypothetical protein